MGQIERYLELTPTGDAAMIGVRFRPTALRRLAGVSMQELTGRSVAVDELGFLKPREVLFLQILDNIYSAINVLRILSTIFQNIRKGIC